MADIFTQAGEEVFTDDIEAARTWYVDWGTAGTTAAKGDTALGAAGGESREAAAMTQPSADQNQWLATLTASGSKTIIEVGVFDASTNGNMIMRSDHAGIALASGDKIEYTIIGTHS